MDAPPQTPLPDVHGPFLDALCKQRAWVTIYLINGVRITGEIDSFDEKSIVLRSEHTERYDAQGPASASRKRIIFNHVISTVLPCDDARGAPEF